MVNVKKYFAVLITLSFILINNPLYSMDSISGTAQAAKKQARRATRYARHVAATLLWKEALSGELSTEEMETLPEDTGMYTLPEEIRREIFVSLILLNNATDYQKALDSIRVLSLVCKELYTLIYETPEVYIPMIENISSKFNVYPYMVARALKHKPAMHFFGIREVSLSGLKPPPSKQ